MECERTELKAFYRRYLARCNEHRFGDLDDFVSKNVQVNGAFVRFRGYAAGLRAVVDAVPDMNSPCIGFQTVVSMKSGSSAWPRRIRHRPAG
jgi:predicted ester cyclase